MSDLKTPERCPACRTSLSQGVVFCPRCRLNLPYAAERIEEDRKAQAVRAVSEMAARDRDRDELIVRGTLIAVPVLLVIALIAILPIGPDVDRTALGQSIISVLTKNGPPSSAKRDNVIDCSHSIWSTKSFSCEGRVDVALVRDARFTIEVAIREADGRICWSSSGIQSDSASSALLEPARYGCLAREDQR